MGFAIVDTHHVYNWVFGIYVPIGLGVFAIFTLAIVVLAVRGRMRAGRGAQVRGKHEANLLEGTYAVVLTCVAALLLYVTFHAEHKEDTVAAHERPATTIDVIGSRWEWTFRYPGHHISRQSGAVGDGVAVVPANRPVRFRLRSLDVIHSFWIPQLEFKRDLIPGTTESITLDFDHPGRYSGSCAEYCGLLHSEMVFTVDAVPAPVYRTWLANGGRRITGSGRRAARNHAGSQGAGTATTPSGNS